MLHIWNLQLVRFKSTFFYGLSALGHVWCKIEFLPHLMQFNIFKKLSHAINFRNNKGCLQRSYKMVKEIIFVSATKLGENTTNIFVTVPHFSLLMNFLKLCRRSFLHNTIFINSLVSFHKEKKITEHLFKCSCLDWKYSIENKKHRKLKKTKN